MLGGGKKIDTCWERTLSSCYCRFKVWPPSPPFLAEVLVLCEEVVEHPERGLEVEVDDVLRPRLGLGEAGVLHQVEGQPDVRDLLLERLQQEGKKHVGVNFRNFR